MKLMSMKQYSKMTKASLVRKIMKALKKLPKTKLIKLCYELEKRRLPTISTTKRNMPRLTARKAFATRPELEHRANVAYWSGTKKQFERAKKDVIKARRKTKRRSTRKPRRLIKGSPEAKRYMAKIRRMRK